MRLSKKIYYNRRDTRVLFSKKILQPLRLFAKSCGTCSNTSRFPRIIAPTADATKGEPGCRFAASEPKSLSGGAPAPAITFENSTPSGESTQASTSGTSANWRAAETCTGDRPQEALGGSLIAQAAEDAGPGAARYTQQATHANVPASAPTTATKSRPRQRQRRKPKAATGVAGEAVWAPLLRLEREARAAADAARAASGGGMEEGHGEESEEENDVWRTYMEIYDDNFDCEF